MVLDLLDSLNLHWSFLRLLALQKTPKNIELWDLFIITPDYIQDVFFHHLFLILITIKPMYKLH